MGWPTEKYAGIATETHFDDREIKVYQSRARTIGELFTRTVEHYPGFLALKEGEKVYSYQQLSNEVNRLASSLYYRWGIKKGDRIGIITDNCPEYCITLLAAAKIGAIAVPLNSRSSGDELEYMINDSGAKILVIDPSYLPVVDDIRGRIPSVQYFFLNTTSIDKNYLSWEDLTKAHGEGDPGVSVDEEDVAIIMYTSGTTGRPKGAMITHFNLCNNVISVSRTLETRAGERTLIAVPLFHITGTMFQFMHMMSIGGTVILLRNFKTQAMLDLLAQEKITFFIGVPTMYVLMMINPGFREYDFSSLKIAAYGGAPMSESTISQLFEHFRGLHLHNTYGATETTGSCTMMPHQEAILRSTSIGLPFMVNDIKVMDEKGKEVPAGEVGELWIKGPNVVKGYWNNPQATASEFIDGFWRSGDLGRLDQDGFVYLMDRKKDMINRGGEKIFCVEVENVICSYPKVQEAAVVGVPDEIFGEQVKAVIVPKPGEEIEEEEIKQFLKGKLADFKIPKHFVFVGELPRNPGGKVIKPLLVKL